MPAFPDSLDSVGNVIDNRTVVRASFHTPAEPPLKSILFLCTQRIPTKGANHFSGVLYTQ